jgi:thioredoxin reductase (NADPH)
MDTVYDAVIIGTGPAGLTAGLFLSRARFHTLLLEKESIGGELMNIDMIDNYPGYPNGIAGAELGSKMIDQISSLGAEIGFANVTGIAGNNTPKVVQSSEGEYLAKTIIIAGGAHPSKLGVPGEREYCSKGVFYCATCDGPHFADKVVAVAGGGNSGVTEALFLTRIVSKVVIIELLPYLTATKILQEKAFSNKKIQILCGTEIRSICGKHQVEALEILDMQTKRKRFLEVDGLLVRVGIEPNTEYLKGRVSLNEKGQIIVNKEMQTETGGVFAAGDIRENSAMQIATAGGDGTVAAWSAQEYLAGIARS